MLENVCGALTSHGGEDFSAIAKAVSKSGYRFGAVVVDAVLFVPQSRPRLFIVAVLESVNFPGTLKSNQPDKDWHSAALIRAYHSLPKDCQENWVWWTIPPPPPRAAVLGDLIEEEPVGVKWHTPEETCYLS